MFLSRLRTAPSALATCALLLGCHNPMAVPAPPPPNPPNFGVNSISVAPDGVTISVGDTLRLHAEGIGSAKAATAFIWTPSAPALAQVDSLGLVQGLTAGTVGIRACAREAPSVCGGATLTIR